MSAVLPLLFSLIQPIFTVLLENINFLHVFKNKNSRRISPVIYFKIFQNVNFFFSNFSSFDFDVRLLKIEIQKYPSIPLKR